MTKYKTFTDLAWSGKEVGQALGGVGGGRRWEAGGVRRGGIPFLIIPVLKKNAGRLVLAHLELGRMTKFKC